MTTRSKVLLGCVFALVAGFAFVSLFGFFSPYDDEGYSVAMIRNISDGKPLYTDQFDIHGPAPFLSKALILRALNVPVTHQTIRLWVMLVWLSSCVLLSAAIWQLTRNAMLTVGGLVVTGSHMFPLRFSPGHPEDFVVLFLSLAIFVASAEASWLTENLRIAVLGCIGAVLVATKINVGVFYLLALGLWMLASIPRQWAWRWIAWVFAAAATSAPVILMRWFLWPSWQLVLMSTLSIFICCAAFFLLPIPHRFGVRQVLFGAIATTLGLAAVVFVAVLHGSRASDLIDQAVLTAAQHSSIIVRPVFTWIKAPVIPVFIFACYLQLVRIMSGSESQPSPSLLKVTLVVIGLIFASAMYVEFYIPLIGPICWLMVFPDGRKAITDRTRSARLFLASVAVFETLQAFPIAGSQTAWSTLALCICSLVLLSDGIAELSERPAGLPRAAKLAVSAVGTLLVLMPMNLALNLWTAYSRAPSLGFSESNLVRIPMAMKADFDWVVTNTSRYCDSLVTQPGLDSFLLWSEPAADLIRRSPILLVDWPLTLPVDQQLRAVAKLDTAARPCAVYNKRLSDWWTNDSSKLTHANLARQPLVSYVQHLQFTRKVGDYEIRTNDAVASKWTDDYLLDGTRTIDGGREAVGLPSELLASDTNVELLFEFQLGHSGPLLSMQQSQTDEDRQTQFTEPLVYIAKNGRLMLRREAGKYVPLLAPTSVVDELWHQLSFRKKQDGWEISLDGVHAGNMADLFAGPRSPRYLQLGPAYITNCRELGSGWINFFGKLRDVRVSRARSQPTQLIAASP